MRIIKLFAFVLTYNSRIVYGLIKSVASPMSSAENHINALFKRLNEAQKQAKSLKLEIKSIRNEISQLHQNLTEIAFLQNNPDSDSLEEAIHLQHVSKRTRSSSINDPPSSDGPTKSKKAKDDIDGKENNFITENGYVVVYTDGACENNGRPNAKAGIGVWFGDSNPLNISKPVIGKATNNTAEIQACVEALKVMKSSGISKAKVITDSKFTISCMTEWIHNWQRNNWKTASGAPVKNKEDLQKLNTLVKTFVDIKWEHIAGHKGHKGNEEADRLAKQGAKSYV